MSTGSRRSRSSNSSNQQISRLKLLNSPFDKAPNLYQTNSNVNFFYFCENRLHQTESDSRIYADFCKKKNTDSSKAADLRSKPNSSEPFKYYDTERVKEAFISNPFEQIAIKSIREKKLVNNVLKMEQHHSSSNRHQVQGTLRREAELRETYETYNNSYEDEDEDGDVDSDDDHECRAETKLSSSESQETNRPPTPKKRVLLSSAELHRMPIAEKFIREAKEMYYVPATLSFFPKKCAKYIPID